MGIRRKAREMALQALYQSDFRGEDPSDSLNQLCENFEIDRKAVSYSMKLVHGVAERREEIDRTIKKHAENWRLGRMALVDRNILRIAVFEMCHLEDLPPSVAINEAIEVARRFSNDDACSFINGILDSIRKTIPSRSE